MGEIQPPPAPVAREASLVRAQAVALKDNRLGNLLNASGQAFSLSAMYGDPKLPEERIPVLYMRTESGSIYRLDAQKNLERRNPDGNNKMVMADLVDRQPYVNLDLVVGRSIPRGIAVCLGYMGSSHITEIITVVDISYTQDALEKITQGRKNTVVGDFEALGK